MSIVSTGLKYIGRSINAHYTGTTLKPPKIKRSLTQKPIYSARLLIKIVVSRLQTVACALVKQAHLRIDFLTRLGNFGGTARILITFAENFFAPR